MLDSDLKICQVTFGSGKAYSYFCGRLKPKVGDYVVVPVGAEQSLKIVKVVGLIPDDPKATKEIYGLILLQPLSTEDDEPYDADGYGVGKDD